LVDNDTTQHSIRLQSISHFNIVFDGLFRPRGFAHQLKTTSKFKKNKQMIAVTMPVVSPILNIANEKSLPNDNVFKRLWN